MKIPILILIYNRQFETKQLIKSLKKIKPKKIYIGADGPKNNFIDKEKCLQTRLVLTKINWSCKIEKNFSKTNLGCKKSITKNLNWFFKKEKEGVILEDDCIPNKDFFRFTKIMLKKYRNNKKIFSISGSNHCKNKKNSTSYYFSKYSHCWGWATWRRAWKKNSPNLNFWPKFKSSKAWIDLHNDIIERRYWNKIFDNVKKKKFDSWAYPWTLSVWYNKGVSIIPNKNLINNIGYGFSSTNSILREKKNYKKYFLDKNIKHPKLITSDFKKDLYVFYNHYKGKNYLWPYRMIYIIELIINKPFLLLKKLLRIVY